MLLGLDLGTTNVKAVVTDRAGSALAHASRSLHLHHLPGDGVEQDLREIEQATREVLREAAHAVDGSAIQAIGVSSQGGAMQVLDQGYRPLGQVISWLDPRGRPFDDLLTTELGRDWFLQRVGHGRAGLAIGQIIRLRKEQPSWFDAGARIGFVGDTIVHRLCGCAVQDGTSCGLTLLYNPTLGTYDPDVLSTLGLAPSQLPQLTGARRPAGGLTRELAQATGLREGIPVSAAIHDQYASTLGTGAVHAGTVMVGTGTAWVLLATLAQLAKPVIDDAFACDHVVSGLSGQILSLVNGGSSLKWALELLGHRGLDSGGVDALLTAAPPGCEGLRFLPFLSAWPAWGLPPGTAGELLGLRLSHQAQHVARAVVEGLSFELNRYLDFLRAANWPIQKLVMGGGAAASRITPQIVADVTGLPVDCQTAGEASLRGAAVLARGLLEPGHSLAGLAEEMLPHPVQIAPGPNAAFYHQRFQEYLQSLQRFQNHPS
jgi:xylulokinase